MPPKPTTKTRGRKRPAHILKLLPYPDFPLSPHTASNRWYKVIRGTRHYFGPLTDWQAALDTYQAQRDDLYAGRKPRQVSAGVTVADAANEFLASKRAMVDAGDIKAKTWDDLYKVAQQITASISRNRVVHDLGPDDFAALRLQLGKTYKTATTLGVAMQRVRSIFKWAYDSDLIEKPVKFGPGFKTPSRKRRRLERHAAASRMFEAEELRQLIDACQPPLKAIILLAINCGFGNSDCADLPIDALKLDAGLLDYPRPKTGVGRRASLWPETVAALRKTLASRPKPAGKADADLVFVTKYGKRWVRADLLDGARDDGTHKLREVDAVALQFGKARKACGVTRAGTGFYSIRHTYLTVADELPDKVAIDVTMGHVDDSMADRYRERVSNDRLKAVADHVHAWLWPAADSSEASHDG